MKQLFGKFFRKLWNDEEAARGMIRGALHTLAISGALFADQIGALIHAPRFVAAIKGAALVAAFIGGNIIGGQTNSRGQS